ncbi:MAG TPA: helix-turn-helix transcriptional regulator [Candidatus Cybelea sp.]|jgi:transcriptional regulator with XRE-family HTH domain|nr:helix-turn-helix transcriptional regulator [Candidatus Cybelea sp.]
MDPTISSPIEICEAAGRRAKERRLALGLRQIDLASQAGIPITTVKRFENRGKGSLETVARIAYALRAENEFGNLFPAHDARSLDEVLAANRPRRRARVRRAPSTSS